MHPTLHKVLHGPHSTTLVAMLKKDGWHEAYRPDWSRIRSWSKLYGAEEDRFAEEFMAAFADIELSVELPGDTPQDWGERAVKMNPMMLMDSINRGVLDRFTEAAGERIFPVGRADESNFLLLGNKGRFFKTVPGYFDLYLLGEGWEGLLHHLQTGDYTRILKWSDR